METHKVNTSFQTGFSDVRIVLVFCFDFVSSSGTSFSFTYGSAKPFGSIGIRFRASNTNVIDKKIQQSDIFKDTKVTKIANR